MIACELSKETAFVLRDNLLYEARERVAARGGKRLDTTIAEQN